jgi:hypothetical protein
MASNILTAVQDKPAPPAEWAAISSPTTSLVVIPRDIGGLADYAEMLATDTPFERRAEGTVAEALAGLGDLSEPLRADIAELASCFAALMAVGSVRIRLEVINTNACRKVHADYTDLRLITTYWGKGTDYVPFGLDPLEDNLVRLAAGDVALFKGRLFSEDHAPCFHRSPPVGDTKEQRLVLVIDTPPNEARMGVVPPPAGC